jgi:2',3'-cyclic-nucleotide 2'-phosphodiesterase (5'-nucleotidase family)
MKKVNLVVFIFLAGLLSSCAKDRYGIRSIEASRIEINSDWDAKANPQMVALVESYKSKLDAEMDVPIGTAAQTMESGYPQSLLSNFTADAIKETAEKLWGKVDFAVMNNGGLRSSLNQGPVTVRNMFEIYSFDNRLVLLELPGKAVKEFFDFIAFNGGQGLSKDMRIVVKKRDVESLEIGGKPLDENKTYRVATIDYLAEGNDGMVAFRQSTNWIDSNETLRDVMIQYVKNLTSNNQEANATLDTRITIIN